MRLIDVDALGELVSHGVVHYEDIMTQPTVDAVPIMRCKDCGHWDYVDSGIDGTAQGECFVFSMMTDDMCFCCWAERKDDIVIIHPEDIVFNSEEDEKAYYEALGAERREE